MYQFINQLLIYRHLNTEDLLYQIQTIDQLYQNNIDYENEAYNFIQSLLSLATQYGFTGNLWQAYLVYILIMSETPYTLVCEKRGIEKGSIKQLVNHDFQIIEKLFNTSLEKYDEKLALPIFTSIMDYQAIEKNELFYNKLVSNQINHLVYELNHTESFYEVMNKFYKQYGVGILGMNKAFRLSDEGNDPFILPINYTSNVLFDDLIGYESQKKQLIANTQAFIDGKKANNVLLYGDAGTGKSTSIKALLNQYYQDGLRIIEVYRHQFKYLSKLIHTIKNRNYKFIIYMDDLSFEEFETDYKYLKAIIEGGLEPKPNNILIYATSNRRHLIRETWDDRNGNGEDIHKNDTIEEKISLSSRFGITIGYYKPMKKEFLTIVSSLAKQELTEYDEKELLTEANIWLMKHGTSGRAARQFLDYYSAK